MTTSARCAEEIGGGKWDRGPNRKRYVNENTGKLISKTGAEAESRCRQAERWKDITENYKRARDTRRQNADQ